MTQAFCDMLYFFSCAVHNTEPQITHEIDLQAVQKEALLQGVWPFVFTSLKRAAEQGAFAESASLLAEWNGQLLRVVMQHTNKNALTAQTLIKFQQAGIPCCVLKGETLAALYALPSCRMSGDVDVLIPSELEREACKILEQEGYELMSRNAGSQHVVAKHPEAGILELHICLYDRVWEEQWFPKEDSITEEPIAFQSEYGDFLQLGYTDGALFIFFHFVKHFLGKGGGIKQLTDVLTYFSVYRNQLDWKRVEEKVLAAKCECLFAHMIGIGVHYLGFSAEEFPPADYEEEIMERLLEDLYERGGFAKKADANGEIRVPYLKKRLEENGENAEEYLQKKQRQSTMSMLFPRRKTMEANYPYVMKSRLLVPVAWVHRAFRFVFRKLLRKNSSADFAYQAVDATQELQAKRLALAEKLKML